jgi:inosose dehydratase
MTRADLAPAEVCARLLRMNRRTFSKTLAMAVASGAVMPPTAWGAPERKLKIGITGLIFRATPREPENLEEALKHMSELGYHSFETWGSVLAHHDQKGTLGAMIARYGIPLRSAFMGINVHDPAGLKESIAQVVDWGKVLKKHGGSFAVVNAGGVKREAFNFKEARTHIIAGLNEHGKALDDIGLGAGLHQHTGSAVDTPDEVYAVMEAVDPKYMKFAPDVGQLQKAGGDSAKIIKDFKSIVVHMHLKDYVGGEHFQGYCPLGQGKVDLKAILDTMEEANPRANIMHELDGSANQPYTPRETAEISKAYLQKLGYEFLTPKGTR